LQNISLARTKRKWHTSFKGMCMKKIFFLAFCCYSLPILSCTNFLITKGASTCGPMIGHTDDGIPGDPRIVYIAAKDHLENKKRAVYLDNFVYPRYIGKRAEAYHLDGKHTTPIGHIAEVLHTYAYIEGNYPIINEHQLALGEGTNLSRFTFDYDKHMRIMGIAELMRLALERCTRAKEAVVLMGKMAEDHGYYGDGESVLLTDTEEGWVFEISCTPNGKGAIWVAKKIPDGEVFVMANEFRIQEIAIDSNDILYSKNLFTLAQANNWLNKDKKSLNWQKIVCPGENHHPYSSLRRVWRLLQKINPSLDLSPYVENAYTTIYPFSTKPQKKIAIEQALNFFRDHYEGTEFDLTKGLAAGPYGCPNRNLADIEKNSTPQEDNNEDPQGAWERAISVPYTVYSYVTQCREDLPDAIGGKVWIGFGEPFYTCYIPCHIGIKDLPKYFNSGNPLIYDEKFGGLPFKLISNWVTQCYSFIIEDIKAKQQQLEKEELRQQEYIEDNAMSEEHISEYLTSYCQDNTQHIISQWWDLFYLITAKYCDGFINIPKYGTKIGYPQWWKNRVGYKKGPINYHQ